MRNRNKINNRRLKEIVNDCYDIINSTIIKNDALNNITDTVLSEFGEYFGPYILKNPNKISMNFIELLDQLLFEIKENISDNDDIRETIMDDLYLRIKINLEIIKNKSIYKKNLYNRMFSYDDTIIISHYQMAEYIPDLMTEYYEQPVLQKPILKALLAFDVEELINFYYQIVKDLCSLDIKCLALVGLKLLSSNFLNWSYLSIKDSQLKKLVEYVESIDLDNIEKINLPYDIYSSFFIINLIEQKFEDFFDESIIEWMFTIKKHILSFDLENSFYINILSSISNIISFMNINCLENYITNKDNLKIFLNIIDILPNTLFNRISTKLDNLGMDFINSSNELVESNIVKLDEVNSNLSDYLFWMTPKII